MNKNKGLDHDEQLLFEVGDINKTGVDLDEIDNLNHMIGDSFSENEIGLRTLAGSDTKSLEKLIALRRLILYFNSLKFFILYKFKIEILLE